MKKIIIAAALILTSGVTAFSLTKNNMDNAVQVKAKTENSDLASKTSSSPKSDIATAD